MKKFYLHTGTLQEGPFSVEELQSRNISADVNVWYEGLTNWVPAASVGELKSLFGTPSLPPQYPERKKSWFSTKRILFILVGIVLILVAVYIQQQIEENNRLAAEARSDRLAEDIKKNIRENITSYVTAGRSEYSYRNLGGIYGLKISVNNSTNYILDNVRVKVTYIKANGGIWKVKMIDYNLVDANTKITQRIPDEDRGVSVEYEIVSIRSRALGLN